MFLKYVSRWWLDFPQEGVFKLFAFVVNDKNKFTYVGALAKDKNSDYFVYYIQLIFRIK